MDALVEDENERPGVEIIEALLGKRLKVTTVDGRVMSGTFVCLDHLGNLLLFDTYCQYCMAGETLERALNQVIIPQAHLKSAQVLVADDDKVLKILLVENKLKGVDL